tara:strand:+ start:661 stop:1692 length:1032 start_codon:yes stop_codon:yes gene_type:complete
MGRTRHYAGCTLNNPTQEEIDSILFLDESKFAWAIFAMEIGEGTDEVPSGTEHIQAAFYFKHGKTLSAVKKLLGSDRWHLEDAHSSQFSSMAYCAKGRQSKDEWDSEGIDGDNYGGLEMESYPLPSGRMGGILRVIGDLPQQSENQKFSVWEQIVEKIESGWSNRELVKKWPAQTIKCQAAIDKYRLEIDRANAGWRDVHTTYIAGDTGCGKTRYVMEKHGYANVHRVTDYDHPFDNYHGQPVLVFEEFRNSLKIQDMLNYLDGYPVELPARYANKLAQFETIYILSNWSLLEQYPNQQMNHPSTFRALLRRIDTYGTVIGEGSNLALIENQGLDSLKGQTSF